MAMPSAKDKSGVIGSARSTGSPALTGKRRGWWRRNWWKLALAVVLVPLLGGGGFVAWKFGPVMFSKPYRTAIEDLKHSRQVLDQLGEPISTNWIPGGGVDSDSARLYFDIWGPKGKAKVAVQAGLRDGQWGFNKFEVTLADGRPLNLMDEEARIHGVDTPPFDPTVPQPKGVTVQEAPPEVNIKIPDVVLPDQK
jgi:Cytochrome oxidase complex assembly protein 1